MPSRQPDRPNFIARTWARLSLNLRAAGKMLFQGYGGQGYNWRLLLPGAQFDYEAAAGDLWRNSAVAACLRWLRINFPEPVLEAVRSTRDGQEEPVPGHDCVKLLQRPNPHYDWYTFGAAWVLSAVVDGNAYALKIRSGSGAVVQLWWLPHWMVWPRWNPDGSDFISYYEYEVNGRRIKIPVSEIIHYRQGIDPRDDRKGFSELKQAVRAVCGLNECDTYTAAILRNMGIPSAVISFEGDGIIQPDDLEELRDQWREQYTSEGRGTPLFAPRKMTVAKLSMTPEELKLDEIPARLEDQVCSVIGLSPMVVGCTSGAKHKTYNNYGEARQAAYEDCLIPMQKSMAVNWTHQLLEPDFSGADRLRFDYRTVQCLSENETEKGNRIGAQYQQYQTIKRSEARTALGYDSTPEDDVYFSEAQPQPAAPEEPDEDDSNTDDSEGTNEKPKRNRVGRVLALLESRLNGNGNGHWHADH